MLCNPYDGTGALGYGDPGFNHNRRGDEGVPDPAVPGGSPSSTQLHSTGLNSAFMSTPLSRPYLPPHP